MARKMTWHPADILAAIRRQGSTLSQIAEAANLHPRHLSLALREPHYRAEQAIAAFLDIPAQTIWPSRYDADGLPLQPRIRKQINREFSGLERQSCGS